MREEDKRAQREERRQHDGRRSFRQGEEEADCVVLTQLML